MEHMLAWTWSFFSYFSAGLGDMAVSNTIGSNVFDILVGLGLPWALQTMCVSYGSEVEIFFPQSLTLFTFSFFLSISLTHTCIHTHTQYMYLGTCMCVHTNSVLTYMYA